MGIGDKVCDAATKKKWKEGLSEHTMSALTDNIKSIVANHLKVKEGLLTNLAIITALPYSLKTVELIEQTLNNKGLSAIENIDYKTLESNSDNIIVCRCCVKDGECYLALILDTEELYESSVLLKFIIL